MGFETYFVYAKKVEDGFDVYIPQWDIHTQGDNLEEAIEMAKDAIGIVGIDYLDAGLDFPEGNYDISLDDFDHKMLVNVDFDNYRKQADNIIH